MKFFDFFSKYMGKMVRAGAGAAQKSNGSATQVENKEFYSIQF
jgi:hypothetical protein